MEFGTLEVCHALIHTARCYQPSLVSSQGSGSVGERRLELYSWSKG